MSSNQCSLPQQQQRKVLFGYAAGARYQKNAPRVVYQVVNLLGAMTKAEDSVRLYKERYR